MAIKPPQDPSDHEGCHEALQQGFDLLVKEAAWAGWEAHVVSQSLEKIARDHRMAVDNYRALGRTPPRQ